MAYDGSLVTMAGILAACKGKITKKGAMMGFVTLEDLTGQIEGLVFPKVYERYVPLLMADNIVCLTGKLSFREEEEPKLLVDTVQMLTPESKALARPLAPALEEDPEVLESDLRWEEDPAWQEGPRVPAQFGPVAAPANGKAAPAPGRTARPRPATDAQLAKQAPEDVPAGPHPGGDGAGGGLCAGRPRISVYVQIQNEKIMLLLAREYWCDGRKPPCPPCWGLRPRGSW